MPKQLNITAKVTDSGTIPEYNSKVIREYLKLFTGKKISIRLGPPEATSQAKKYYWAGVIRPILEALREAGFTMTSEQLHDIFKKAFLHPEIIATPWGDKKEYSTKHLDSTTFYYFVENIRTHPKVVELGVYIESPEEYKRRTGSNFSSYAI